MKVLYYTLGVFVLDQVTKMLVKGIAISWLGLELTGMPYGSSIPLIGDWLKFTFIENPNMAFGLEFGGKLFLTVFALVASVGIIIYLYYHRNEPFPMRLSLALILAGALGNLMDRVFYGVIYGYAPLLHGNVVDFIDFDLFLIHFGEGAFKFWPIFNVADSAVTIGVVILLFVSRVAKATARDTVESGSEKLNSPLQTASSAD